MLWMWVLSTLLNVTVVRGWLDDVFRNVEYRPEDAIVGVGVVVCAVGVVENELAFAVIDNEAMNDNDGVIDEATDWDGSVANSRVVGEFEDETVADNEITIEVDCDWSRVDRNNKATAHTATVVGEIRVFARIEQRVLIAPRHLDAIL
jgi:hypothetical protein